MGRNQREVLVELLVIQAQAGEPQAIGSLAAILQKELVAFAFRLVSDWHTAADVVQDAWLSIIRGIGRLEDPATFRAWAFRIVHNKSMDRLRTIVRDRRELESFQQTTVAVEPADNPEQHDEPEALRKLIVTLPQADQVVLSLYYEHNLSIREISSITGTTEMATKSKLYHVRQKLKQKLSSMKEMNDDDSKRDRRENSSSSEDRST